MMVPMMTVVSRQRGAGRRGQTLPGAAPLNTVGSQQRGAGSRGQTHRRAVVGSRRLAVTACVSCLLSAVATPPMAAQVQAPREVTTPAGIHYGKWAAAAVAAGFTALGIRSHNRADDDFRALADYCRVQGTCAIATDGRYTDPAAEARYQHVVHGDRAARVWLISGQAALVGSVVLFVLELKRERGPANIPYAGLVVEPGPQGTRIGLRIPIR